MKMRICYILCCVMLLMACAGCDIYEFPDGFDYPQYNDETNTNDSDSTAACVAIGPDTPFGLAQ